MQVANYYCLLLVFFLFIYGVFIYGGIKLAFKIKNVFFSFFFVIIKQSLLLEILYYPVIVSCDTRLNSVNEYKMVLVCAQIAKRQLIL